MVFYYKSQNKKHPYIIYSGRNKEENELLIACGWREDIWFHVDGLSSAHIYLRPPEPQLPGEVTLDIDNIPKDVLDEICQVTKENSISGSKAESVNIVYTPWYNLKKEAGFADGQVTFHNSKLCRYIRNVKKNNDILKPILKSKSIDFDKETTLKLEQQQRQERERARAKAFQRQLEKNSKAEAKRREAEQAEKEKMRRYESVMKEENYTTNDDMNGYDSDDFM